MGLRAMAWAFLTARPSTERFVLVALAEHADEDGVCWPGVSRLTERTGYNRVTVQRALARLEVDGLLSRQERCVPGGRQTSNLYVLDLGWQPPAVKAKYRAGGPENGGERSADFSAGGAAVGLDSASENDANGPGSGGVDGQADVRAGGPADAGALKKAAGGLHSAAPPAVSACSQSSGGGLHSAAPGGCTAQPLELSLEPSKEPPCPNLRSDGGFQDSKPAGKVADPEDLRLAGWMFSLVLGLHPEHRQPNWPKWSEQIRLMRERDKREHREIAELFRWANRHAFWQANILSPAKLRERWDQLVIRRKADEALPGTVAARAPVIDRRCAFVEHSLRCTCAGVTSTGNHPSSPWYCAPHLERVEQGDTGDAVPRKREAFTEVRA